METRPTHRAGPRQHAKYALRKLAQSRRFMAHAIANHPQALGLYWAEQSLEALQDAMHALHDVQDYTGAEQANHTVGLSRRVDAMRKAVKHLAMRHDATPGLRAEAQLLISRDDFLAGLPDGPLGPVCSPCRTPTRKTRKTTEAKS